MCGRFNVISHPLTRLLFEITGQEFPLADRYNIAPSEDIPVIVKERGDNGAAWDVREMRWWLVPRWVSEPSTRYSMFNAKSEGLMQSRAYRTPFESSRCIIPASGYYEWQKAGDRKVPYYIAPRDAPGFAFAGLWDRWERGEQVIESCTMITTAVHPDLAFIHTRMPVHLTQGQVQEWMDHDTPLARLKALLLPRIDVPIRAVPVSTYVNNSRNRGPQCVEPAGEEVAIG